MLGNVSCGPTATGAILLSKWLKPKLKVLSVLLLKMWSKRARNECVLFRLSCRSVAEPIARIKELAATSFSRCSEYLKVNVSTAVGDQSRRSVLSRSFKGAAANPFLIERLAR